MPFALLKLAKNHNLSRASERFGLIKPIKDEVIWVHCVSVGEFLAAKVLIDALLKKHKVLVTTTTKTGSDCVIKHYQNKVFHQYFPFDCPLIIKRYLKQIKPKMLLLLETEIWANLINQLHHQNTPILLVNARLSSRSMQKYKNWIPKLTKQTLNKISLIAAQNQNSAQRFEELGANKRQVVITGNIKFDQNFYSNTKQIKMPISKQKKVLLFASTHEGEEEQILKSFTKIKTTFNALLVIVPRHPQRFNQVFELIKSQQLTACKRSDNQINTNCEVMLGDSMGEMMSYFNAADVVFMGGSLNNTGGHNMLEPAALAKPILFGESVFNFAEISQDLLTQNAAIQVQNADALFTQILNLLNNPQKAKTLGENAHKYLQSKQGTTKKLMQQIALFL